MNQLALQQKSKSLIAVDPAAVAMAEASKARIQAAYIMAMQNPRVEDQARAKILSACKRPSFAKAVEFQKPVGKKQVNGKWVQNYVNGLSIRFAEVALKEWGNLMTEVQTLYEDDNVRRVRVSVLDLETNTQFSKELQIAKTVERRSNKDREVVGERTNTYGDTVYIVRATDDEVSNKENALISKAVRNEGLRLIPAYIKEDAVATARETLSKEIATDFDGAKRKMIDSFSNVGVWPKDIEKFIGHGLDTLSPKEVEQLRGIYRAISDGEASWSDFVTSAAADDDVPKEANELAKKILSGSAETKKPPAVKSDPPQVKRATVESSPPGEKNVEREPAADKAETFAVKTGSDLNEIQFESAVYQFAADSGGDGGVLYPKASDYINVAAKQAGKTRKDMIDVALADMAAFMSRFFKSIKTPEQVDPRDRDGGQDETAGVDQKSTDFVNEWLRLHGENYKKFVVDNIDRFRRYPQWVQDKARAKWADKVGGDWPADSPAGTRENDEAGRSDVDGGEGLGGEVNDDDGTTVEIGITDSDEWQELSMLQLKHRDIYAAIMKGRLLRTVQDLRDAIASIDAAVDFKAGGQA